MRGDVAERIKRNAVASAYFNDDLFKVIGDVFGVMDVFRNAWLGRGECVQAGEIPCYFLAGHAKRMAGFDD